MSDILKFFIKRVGILYILLLLACFLSKYQRIPMMVSLTLSVLFSLLRFGLLEFILRHLGGSGNKRLAVTASIVVYIFSLAVIGITIVFAIRIGVHTFFAALAGSLSVLAVLMVNAITEALGITKNQYGQKVK
jgi:hypothetical protein